MTEAIIDEELPEALDGERLDRVVSMLDGCSRSRAATIVDEGGVEVDGAVVTQRSFRVEGGMRVRFASTPVAPSGVEPESSVEFHVLHDDEHIIVVDKPSGLVVHPGAGRPDHTLANGLLARYPELVDIGDPNRPGIVHRLDAETSGVLVVARTGTAYDALVEMMAAHLVERVYLAIVDGLVTDDRGTIDAPIGRATRQRTKMAVVADGRHARTHYEVLDRNAHDGATLLGCELETGRTHQIRVHLAAIGHPVLGDTVYGPRTGSPLIGRVALHAHQLGLDHPVTGEAIRFEAPVPDDLTALRDRLFGGANRVD